MNNPPAAPCRLETEYLGNPLGIDVAYPRLSWLAPWDHAGAVQTAYRIEARTAGNLVWDSGRFESAENALVEYGGPPLNSRQRIDWRVKLWGEKGAATPWSAWAFFEMGLLKEEDWIAPWMGADGAHCPLFRCSFTMRQPRARVVRARLYASGLGYYEPRLNGVKVGDMYLAPEYTDYTVRVHYHAFEVAANLKDGENVLGVILGNGWYGKFNFGRPMFRFQLEIDYTDGEHQVVGAAPREWQTSSGPLLFADIYNGEVYDARLETTGWDAPGFPDGSHWGSVAEAGLHVFPSPPPTGRMQGIRCPPIRMTENIKPVTTRKLKADLYVVDFGQNFAGFVRLVTKGKSGTRVILQYAELVHPDDTVNQENLMGAWARDIYILKGGDAQEAWEPRFTYHGFRYVQVEGVPSLPVDWQLEGCVLHSDLPATGTFKCSDRRLERLVENARWTLRSNLMGVPTDCPQRAERQGYGGDMMMTVEAVMRHFRAEAFYTKWSEDLRDTQDPATGSRWSPTVPNWPLGKFDYRRVPQAPQYQRDGVPLRQRAMITDFPRDGYQADAVWTAANTVVPWKIYTLSGDVRMIRDQYPAIARHLEFLAGNLRFPLCPYGYYGDWLVPAMSETLHPGDGWDPKRYRYEDPTDPTLLATAFMLWQFDIAAAIAGILGTGEQPVHQRRATLVRQALGDTYYSREKGSFGSQTSDAMALCLDFAPTGQKARILAAIVQDIKRHDGHIWTGLIGTPFLLEALSAGGRFDVAWQVVTREGYPGWMHMLANGATTMWERWENWVHDSMNSHNHPGWACLSEWVFRWIGGIRSRDEAPGYRRFTIGPSQPPGMDQAECVLDTVRGCIRSGWRQEKERLVLDLVVPVGCQVDAAIAARHKNAILLQDGVVSKTVPTTDLRFHLCLPAGKHRLEIKDNRSGQ